MAEDPNASVISEFRETKGKLGGGFAGAPVLLLHTVGAKSGLERVHPMMYLAGSDAPGDDVAADDHTADRLYVFASFAGRPENPAWYHNLVANPQVEVEVGAEKYPATASVVTGGQRDEIYAEQARRYPGFAEYETKTTRVIPVVALTRN